MEIDSNFEIVTIPESTGAFLHDCNFGVHPKATPGQIVRVFKSLRCGISMEAKCEEAVMGWVALGRWHYLATVRERGKWKADGRRKAVERHVRNQGKPREKLRQLKLF